MLGLTNSFVYESQDQNSKWWYISYLFSFGTLPPPYFPIKVIVILLLCHLYVDDFLKWPDAQSFLLSGALSFCSPPAEGAMCVIELPFIPEIVKEFFFSCFSDVASCFLLTPPLPAFAVPLWSPREAAPHSALSGVSFLCFISLWSSFLSHFYSPCQSSLPQIEQIALPPLHSGKCFCLIQSENNIFDQISVWLHHIQFLQGHVPNHRESRFRNLSFC